MTIIEEENETLFWNKDHLSHLHVSLVTHPVP